MNKKERPIPSPPGSDERQRYIEYMMLIHRFSYRKALARISAANFRARNTPMPGERCGARTKRQRPCMCKALANGRCRLHGGLSTGPKTLEGKNKTRLNLIK